MTVPYILVRWSSSIVIARSAMRARACLVGTKGHSRARPALRTSMISDAIDLLNRFVSRGQSLASILIAWLPVFVLNRLMRRAQQAFPLELASLEVAH